VAGSQAALGGGHRSFICTASRSPVRARQRQPPWRRSYRPYRRRCARLRFPGL